MILSFPFLKSLNWGVNISAFKVLSSIALKYSLLARLIKFLFCSISSFKASVTFCFQNSGRFFESQNEGALILDFGDSYGYFYDAKCFHPRECMYWTESEGFSCECCKRSRPVPQRRNRQAKKHLFSKRSAKWRTRMPGLSGKTCVATSKRRLQNTQPQERTTGAEQKPKEKKKGNGLVTGNQ